MQRARMRLIVAILLFVGWLGWLAYLAATATHPIILSRPQCLYAQVIVHATVTGEEHASNNVTIREILHGIDPKDRLKPEAEVEILQLDKCGSAQGWEGPGEYLLPVSVNLKGEYHITHIPESPGYAPESMAQVLRIYPYNQEVKRQLTQILSKKS
jgi:hypothetical protein